MRTAALALAALLALTACGGSDSEAAPSQPKSVTPAQVAERLGCVGYGDQETQELYVEKVGGCFVGAPVNENVRILTFANNEARDNFAKVAEGFGGRYVSGDLYLVEVESPEAEAAVKAKVG